MFTFWIACCVWTTSVFLTDSCPANSYTLIDNSACYWFTNMNMTAAESNKLCERENGRLAAIPNQNVSEQIKAMGRTGTFWIGVNDIDNEGVYENSDGSPVCWTNWAKLQPTDRFDHSLNEDCVRIENGKWFDYPCRYLFNAICYRKFNSCPVNSYTLKDKSACYWATSQNESHAESINICKRDNGTLAIIPNRDVNKQIKQFGFIEGKDTLYIGVNDKDTEGVYINSDGSPVSWTNWRIGRPFDKDSSRDCVLIDREGNWYDNPCESSYKALCFRKLESSTFDVSTAKGTESQDSNICQCTDYATKNIAELIIPAGAVGIVIGSVVTVVIMSVLQRCRATKQQSQDHKYDTLDVNRSTVGQEYDVIGITKSVKSRTEELDRDLKKVYINTNV